MGLAEKQLQLHETASIYSSPVFLIKVCTEHLLAPSFYLIKPNEFAVILKLSDLSVLDVKHDEKNRKRMTFSLSVKEKKKLKKIFMEVPEGGVENVWAQIINFWNALNPKFAVDKEKYRGRYK